MKNICFTTRNDTTQEKDNENKKVMLKNYQKHSHFTKHNTKIITTEQNARWLDHWFDWHP